MSAVIAVSVALCSVVLVLGAILIFLYRKLTKLQKLASRLIDNLDVSRVSQGMDPPKYDYLEDLVGYSDALPSPGGIPSIDETHESVTDGSLEFLNVLANQEPVQTHPHKTNFEESLPFQNITDADQILTTTTEDLEIAKNAFQENLVAANTKTTALPPSGTTSSSPASSTFPITPPDSGTTRPNAEDFAVPVSRPPPPTSPPPRPPARFLPPRPSQHTQRKVNALSTQLGKYRTSSELIESIRKQLPSRQRASLKKDFFAAPNSPSRSAAAAVAASSIGAKSATFSPSPAATTGSVFELIGETPTTQTTNSVTTVSMSPAVPSTHQALNFAGAHVIVSPTSVQSDFSTMRSNSNVSSSSVSRLRTESSSVVPRGNSNTSTDSHREPVVNYTKRQPVTPWSADEKKSKRKKKKRHEAEPSTEHKRRHRRKEK